MENNLVFLLTKIYNGFGILNFGCGILNIVPLYWARQRKMKENLIQKKSFEFALKIIVLYKQLKEKGEFILSKQVLRSGTSIGANIEEAIAGQTKKDFLTKCSIASKEARETKYWLRLLQESNIFSGDYELYIKEIDSIINILTKIVKTTTNSISYKN